MKRLILSLCITLSCILLGCSDKQENYPLQAKVLTINENILAGQLIGHFLGGWFSNDLIKIGIQFDFKDQMYLVDLVLSHAELAYYRNTNTLDLVLSKKANCNFGLLYLGSRVVGYSWRNHFFPSKGIM